MGDKTRIQWTDATWNPMTGCSPVSEGCLNCYAKGQSLRLQRMDSPKYTEGFACRFHADALMQPIRWQRPRMVFVNSMSDTFHPDFSNEQIATLYNVMASCPRHTFQVLTKRPERMLEWYAWVKKMRIFFYDSLQALIGETPWPLPNVWVGVTTENQRRYDERKPLLMQVPAVLHFVSIEPVLEGIYLRGNPVDWVIAGCESGPNRRPCHADWLRTLAAQCREGGTRFFLKQMEQDGAIVKMPALDGRVWNEHPGDRNHDHATEGSGDHPGRPQAA